MNKIQRIIKTFLDSAEGYFHVKTVLEKMVKQPRGQFGEYDNRPERWNYLDKRFLTADHYKQIVDKAYNSIDQDLLKKIPDVALKASLDYAIHDVDKCAYQSKIDAKTYKNLLDVLRSKVSKEK